MIKQLKSLLLPLFSIVIIILCAFIVFQAEYNPEKIISKSAVAISTIEELSKLEVLKYKLDLIIDETNKKDFLWQDWLMPDDKILISMSGEASACIDFSDFNIKNINKTDETSWIITLPSPQLCGIPAIDFSTYKEHQKLGFGADQFREQNLQNVTKKLTEKAINSGILTQAKEVGKKAVKAIFRSIINDPNINMVIKYENEK